MAHRTAKLGFLCLYRTKESTSLILVLNYGIITSKPGHGLKSNTYSAEKCSTAASIPFLKSRTELITKNKTSKPATSNEIYISGFGLMKASLGTPDEVRISMSEAKIASD